MMKKKYIKIITFIFIFLILSYFSYNIITYQVLNFNSITKNLNITYQEERVFKDKASFKLFININYKFYAFFRSAIEHGTNKLYLYSIYKCKKALEIYPNQTLVYNYLGQYIYLRKGWYKDAIKSLELSLKINNKQKSNYFYLGLLYGIEKNKSKAINNIDKYLKFNLSSKNRKAGQSLLNDIKIKKNDFFYLKNHFKDIK